MEVFIRKAGAAGDYSGIEAYLRELASTEQLELFKKLQESNTLVPELLLLATDGREKIVGIIVFSIVHILDSENIIHQILSMDILCIKPESNLSGLDKQLLEAGLQAAESNGFKSVITLSDSSLYSEFGFLDAAMEWGIRTTFEIPDKVLMAFEIKKDALAPITGIVVYPEGF